MQVKEKERRIQQRKEKAEKDRLKALKEHDTEAYYNLLKEHKNDKILAVLNETDKYLRALGSAVPVTPLPPSGRRSNAACMPGHSTARRMSVVHG